MPVNPNYIFRINNVYEISQDDQTEISNDLVSSTKWSDGYKTFKENIRTHLKLQQNGRCAFCRLRISIGTSWSNLEHLVSKTDYPQFMFKSENLVYCCTRCNMSKVKKNVLINPEADKLAQEFPENSNGFLMINPYHDNYEEHIDFLDNIIIVSKNSEKGTETIDLYKLFRPELAEDRAFESQLDKKTLNEQLLQMLTLPTIDESTTEQINNVIQQLPNWTI
jgi:uncharacterized protein (TIGR02646 family)